MNFRNLLGALFLIAAPCAAFAGAEDMQVYAFGDVGCEYMMSTNTFELAPGESIEIELDVSQCTPQQLGTFLFYGYAVKGKNKSVPLTSNDDILLGCLNMSSLEQETTDGGPMLMELETPAVIILSAENMRRRSVKIRLRSNLGL